MNGQITTYGFEWGPITVTRLGTVTRNKGEYCILEVKAGSHKLTIYVSPTGRSVRVFDNHKELKPDDNGNSRTS